MPTENTVRAWVLKAFQERRSDVKASLQSARSRIQISFDGWQAPNGLHLPGAVGHWLDGKKKLQWALLALPQLPGGDGSTDLAPAPKLVFNEYRIGSRLGAFETDNASNNDTCISELAICYPIDVAEQCLRWVTLSILLQRLCCLMIASLSYREASLMPTTASSSNFGGSKALLASSRT